MASGGEITRRVMYYERRQRNGKDIVEFLPFALVQIEGLQGKVFEPVDCIRERPGGFKPDKEVAAFLEFDGKARMFYCEAKPDNEEMALHSFGAWEFPPE